MPNTDDNDGFNMGQIANLLGNEEEDKRRFFSEEVQGRPWASTLPTRTGSTSSLPEQGTHMSAPPTANASLSASTIQRVSVASTGGWGQAIENITSTSSVSQPAAEVNTNSQSSQPAGLSTVEALNNIKSQESQRVAAREARKQADLAERERKRQQLQEDQRLRREARQREQEELQMDEVESPKSVSQQKKLVTSPSRSSLLSLSQNTSEQVAFRTTSQNVDIMQTVITNPPGACTECPVYLKRITNLEEQLEEAKTTFINQQSAHSQQLQQLSVEFEASKERVEQLQTENELLQAKLEGRSVRNDIHKGVIELVTKEEMISLRQEIQSQEVLCGAYQTEAEKNSREIKGLRQQVAELQKELLCEKKSPTKNNNSFTAAEGPPDSTTQVVRDLTREAAQLKERMRIQQEEHTLAISTLEKDKRSLASKLGQHDTHKADDDALRIRDLELQLKKQKHEYEEELTSVKEKLLWYVKNQELLSNKDTLVEQQGTEIEALKSRVVELDGVPISKKKTPDQRQYIAELQKKIKNLEDIVKSKYPNSIPELIRACKPTPTEVDLYRTLQERIETLNNELTTREQAYENGIRLLRQEADKVALQYQERQKSLEDELKSKVRSATNSKIKELERRVEDTRTYYVKKVRELEQQVLGFRKNSKKTKPTSDSSVRNNNSGSHPRVSTAIQTDVVCETVHAPTTAQLPPQQSITHYSNPLMMQDHTYHLMEVGRLRSEIESQRRLDSDKSSELSSVKHTLILLQRDIDHSAQEKIKYQEEVRQLQSNATVSAQNFAVREQELLSKHRFELDSQKQQWDEDVRRITSSGSPISEVVLSDKSDRCAYISSIKRKLAVLEREHTLKHSEFQRSLSETRRLAAFELDVQKQKMNLVIQSKTNEIQRFRLALDSLMEELTSLKVHKEVQFMGRTA